MGTTLPSIFEQFPIPTKQTVNPIDGSNVAYEPNLAKTSEKDFIMSFKDYLLFYGQHIYISAGNWATTLVYTVPLGYNLYIYNVSIVWADDGTRAARATGNYYCYIGGTTTHLAYIKFVSDVNITNHGEINKDFSIPVVVRENQTINMSAYSAPSTNLLSISGFLLPKNIKV